MRIHQLCLQEQEVWQGLPFIAGRAPRLAPTSAVRARFCAITWMPRWHRG
jgi:hypothetical protein